MRRLPVVVGGLVVLAVIIGLLVPWVIVGLTFAIFDQSVPNDIPPKLEPKRDLLARVVEDARFAPPLTIGAEPRVCYAGGFAPKGEVCDVEGKATFAPDTDLAPLAPRLRARGWIENGGPPSGDRALDWYRKVDDRDVCLSVDVGKDVVTVKAWSDTACTDRGAG